MSTLQRIIVILGLILIGFLIGRWSTPIKEEIKYIKGETIRDSIPYPVPVDVEVPAKPVLPVIPDTIRIPGKPIYVVQKVDTSAIIQEYVLKKNYSETLFDNGTAGRLVVGAEIQYNSVNKFWYDYDPITKQITQTKERKVIPFVSASGNTFGIYGAGGGFFYNNTGYEFKYLHDGSRSGFEFGLKFSF